MSGRPPEAPPFAWRKMPWTKVPFASLDFEATGLDFSKDTIISFGVVPVTEGRIDVGGAVYQLVDPVDVALDPRAITVHMLRPVDLVDAPSLDAAREALRAALGRRFLIAWFAEVEAAFLAKIFGGGRKRWMRRTVDVRRLVAALEGVGHGPLTLAACAERYKIPVADPHHALDDALVTAQLFLVMARKLADRGMRSVAELADVAEPSAPNLRRARPPW
ncbi:MAG: 3'-5' exonuclease [Actinomycetota bacterium]